MDVIEFVSLGKKKKNKTKKQKKKKKTAEKHGGVPIHFTIGNKMAEYDIMYLLSLLNSIVALKTLSSPAMLE